MQEQPTGGKVINLMDALRRSVQAEAQERPAATKKGRKAAAGQKEMLLPIAGKKAAHAEGGKSHAESGKSHAESGKSRGSAKHRKAG